jgi:arylsulfatase A-like enzyme
VVHRFADEEPAGAGPITTQQPAVTIRDDTRYVLRAPPRMTLIAPKKLEDRSGDRLLTRTPFLPMRFLRAPALIVLPRVRVGPEWHEPPPRVVPTVRVPQHTTARVEIPIPANPDLQPVVISAAALAAGLVRLDRVDTPPIEIPSGAELRFAIGVMEPDWGYDAVRFSALACREEDCDTVFEGVFDPTDGNARWQEHRVSLAALDGERRRFRFLVKRLDHQAPFSLPVWGNPTLYAPSPRSPGVRNVILLSVDTLRADHLGSYGYRHDTAPFIEERFARGGTIFENLVAAATITTPSHASMFTALSPVTHGTVHGMKRLPANIPTLAERLREAGIDTGAITENGWMGVSHGFGRGFDTFLENKSPDIMEPLGQVDATFEEARQWLEKHRDHRFFLFLHTFQVHAPYAPPPRYAQLFSDHEAGPIDEDSPSHLRQMADYDREIRYVDDELRRLFETIDALRLGDDTVFILTSDHGEAFLEHDVLQHGSRLDEEVVRVPLMFWGSGITAGRRVTTPVGHVDVMPTILELAGIDAPDPIEGSSLVGLLDDEKVQQRFANRPLYSEARGAQELGRENRLRHFQPPGFLVRVGDRKLERYRTREGGFRYEYYDLSADPLERNDLYPERPEEARDLLELLESYEERGRELRRRIDAGESNRTEDPVLLDPREEEKLRALGYLE